MTANVVKRAKALYDSVFPLASGGQVLRLAEMVCELVAEVERLQAGLANCVEFGEQLEKQPKKVTHVTVRKK